jgi:GNAT superfamily N-acetyltransferase
MVGWGSLYGESWERREARWRRAAKEAEDCRTSPACQFMNKSKQAWNFPHLYGRYQHFEQQASIDFDFHGPEGEPRITYGYSILIRSVFVLPKHRQKGVTLAILERSKAIADETGCVLLAVCSPFEYVWDYDEALTDIEQLKECADRFGWSSFAMEMLELKKRTNKNKQIRMKRRFLDSGFVPVDIRDGMGDPKKFGNWAVAYVPSSTPEVYRNVIEERLKV